MYWGKRNEHGTTGVEYAVLAFVVVSAVVAAVLVGWLIVDGGFLATLP